MKVVDISNEIFLELGQPANTSLASISFWVRAKIGEINNLLFENFIIDPSSLELIKANHCVTQSTIDNSGTSIDTGANQINNDAVAIIKKLYKVYYYDVQIMNLMNTLLTDIVIEVNDQGSSVKRINRNDILKTFQGLKKDEQAILKDLINAYRIKHASPQQVAGDDTTEGYYTNLDVLWPGYGYGDRWYVK